MVKPEFNLTGRNSTRRGLGQRGALVTELVIALGILGLILIPISFEITQETRAFQASYYRAAAMQIVDGEMEILAAGLWRAIPSGRQEYPVRAAAATNLPPGHFVLTRTERNLRLEWIPQKRGQGGGFAREITLK